MHCYMPDDVRFKGLDLEVELENEGFCDLIWGNGSPGGVDAADFRSSACFLPPPSRLNGRNQPEGAGDAAPLEDADAVVDVSAPAASQQLKPLQHKFC